MKQNRIKDFETWKVSLIGTFIFSRAELKAVEGTEFLYPVKVLGHNYMSKLGKKDIDLAYRAYCLKFIVEEALPFLAGDDAFNEHGDVKEGFSHLYGDLYVLASDMEKIR